MLEVYKQWELLFAAAEKFKIPKVKRQAKVFYAGIGGSGIAGTMVNMLEPKFHYEVLGNSGEVPYQLGPDSLVIAVSYSGNTHETRRMLELSLKKGASAVIVTSGGALEQYAAEHSIPVIKVAPADLPPRVAFPLLLVPVVRLLNETYGMGYDAHDLYEGVVASKGAEKEAEKLASQIAGKIPVIYASRYLPIAKRFKQEVNENGKYPSYYGEVPEIYHNEVEGYKRDMNLFPILVSGSPLDEVVCEVIKPYKITPKFDSVLKNIGSMVYFVDLVSIYLAKKIGEDPYPVEVIKKVKAATNKII